MIIVLWGCSFYIIEGIEANLIVSSFFSSFVMIVLEAAFRDRMNISLGGRGYATVVDVCYPSLMMSHVLAVWPAKLLHESSLSHSIHFSACKSTSMSQHHRICMLYAF